MKMRIAATAALTLSAGLLLAGCAIGTPQSSGDAMAGMDHGSSADLPSSVNETDLEFTQMMIVHHQQAIDMSDTLLRKGDVNPRVAALAEGIRQAQGPEIEQLETWLSDWGVEPTGDAGEADNSADVDADGGHGAGMMSADDLAALEGAAGPLASKLFLEQMVEHHEGAVEMAQVEIDGGKFADAVSLAEEIVSAQNDEISEMKELLAKL